jgi:hypothetical protein
LPLEYQRAHADGKLIHFDADCLGGGEMTQFVDKHQSAKHQDRNKN